MYRRLFILLFVLFSGQLVKAHPAHVSLITIDFARSGIDVFIKINASDLIRALQTYQIAEIKPGTSICEKHKDTVQKYINNHFAIQQKDTTVSSVTIVACSIEGDYAWIDARLSLNNANTEYLTLKNTLLIDVSPDQVNLVILNNDKAEKSLRFTSNKTIMPVIF